MAHRLHVHIVASSRRVIVGLRVLLMASGMVDQITLQDPQKTHVDPDGTDPDLVVLDLAGLSQLDSPRTVLRHTVPGRVPWCALAHSRAQERDAASLGASYLLPLGFAPELLFSILAGCLPVVRTPAFSPVPVASRHAGPFI